MAPLLDLFVHMETDERLDVERVSVHQIFLSFLRVILGHVLAMAVHSECNRLRDRVFLCSAIAAIVLFERASHLNVYFGRRHRRKSLTFNPNSYRFVLYKPLFMSHIPSETDNLSLYFLSDNVTSVTRDWTHSLLITLEARTSVEPSHSNIM